MVPFFQYRPTLIPTQKQPGCKKRCGPVQSGQCEKSSEIKGGGQEMAVMVYVDGKNFNKTIQVSFVLIPSKAGMRQHKLT